MTPRDLYSLDRDPTFDQLKNSFNGHTKQENDRFKALRNMIYGASKYNSSNIAGVWSSKASRYILKQPFDWERPQKTLTPQESKSRVEAWLNAR